MDLLGVAVLAVRLVQETVTAPQEYEVLAIYT